MERLSIQEIIEHCHRRTEQYENANGFEKLNKADLENTFVREYWEHRQVGEYLEELLKYRQLEEQGLLLKLPCRVGTHIYIAHHYWVDEGHICGLAECDDVDCACFKVYEDPDTYSMVSFDEFGVTWFLSEDEAEKAVQAKYGTKE